jgi:hypothetical protein
VDDVKSVWTRRNIKPVQWDSDVLQCSDYKELRKAELAAIRSFDDSFGYPCSTPQVEHAEPRSGTKDRRTEF